MGQASFHVGNHTGHAAEEEAKQLRAEISELRKLLTDEVVELDNRRKQAVVKVQGYSDMIKRIIGLVTLASAAFMAFVQVKKAYETLRNEWRRQKKTDQTQPA
jgi:large-conductance mechanosensitive channel